MPNPNHTAAPARSTRVAPCTLAVCIISLLVTAATADTATAEWNPVAPGIDYAEFTTADPNNLFVARMQRDHPDCTLDTAIGNNSLITGRERVSTMAERYENAIGYWGQAWGNRYDVIAAINGDFFNVTTGEPTSGQVASGWYAKRFNDFTGGSGFAWQLDRDLYIGECVRHLASKQKLTYVASGNTRNINGINVTRGTDQLILYTHHYAVSTQTPVNGVEVLVKMSRPTLVLPLPAGAVGTVTAIRENQAPSQILFDHVVLSGHGSAASNLLANLNLGDEVRISQEITHYQHDCSTSLPLDWTKTYASVGGSFHFLKNGVVPSFTNPGATAQHPRTAIAYNDTYLYFVVVDGRSAISVGMNMTELGTFCLNTLAATEGINQDGGGSSALWVNGQVRNDPSDGSERSVANAVLMVNTVPASYATRFSDGEQVCTAAGTTTRVGPGFNYAVNGSVPAGRQGVIQDHDLNGVNATDRDWWWCAFDGVSGWVIEYPLQTLDHYGDFDEDGVITENDWPAWAACAAGPRSIYPVGDPCRTGDSDCDGDVDLQDLAASQRAFNQP